MAVLTSDPAPHITQMTEFAESPLFEMLGSLQSLMDPVRNPEWKRTVQDTLGSRFMDRLRTLYNQFHGGCDFLELAVERGPEESIETFLDWVESLEPRHFLFAVLGRLYPEDQLPEQISRNAVESFLENMNRRDHYAHMGADWSWCDDVEGLKAQLITLWREYHQGVFSEHYDGGASQRRASIEDKRALLESEGGLALLKNVSGMDQLPRELPEGVPYTEIIYVPVVWYHRRRTVYYGDGNITILYDAYHLRNQPEIQEARRDHLVRLSRVLGDPVRLRMLQLIATDEYRFNGRKLAKYMYLSPSVVSRHLKQLREADLVEEHSPDNRNVVYRVNYDAVESLSSELVKYIKEIT